MGHRQFPSVWSHFRYRYYMPAAEKCIRNFLARCTSCQRYARPDPFLSPGFVPKAKDILTHWSIDYFGPLPADADGTIYVLLAECAVTRSPEAIPAKAADAESTAAARFSRIFSRYGVISSFQSDNGPHFVNEVIDNLLRHFRVIHHCSTPYYPQSNGRIERLVRTLKSAIKLSFWDRLSLAVTEGHLSSSTAKVNWTPLLYSALWSYRVTSHSATGVSPSFLVYGFDISLPANAPINLLDRPVNPAEVVASQIKHLQTTVHDIRQQQFDLRLPPPQSARPQYSVSQHMWLRASATDQMPPVFTPRWKGPYVVYQVLDRDAYPLRANSRIAGKRSGYPPTPINGHRLRGFQSSDRSEIAQLLA